MSVNEPSSTWRLTTPGGIPMKLVSRSGSFGQEDGTVTEIAIIKSNTLSAFLDEYLSRPFGGGGIIFPATYVSLPGLGTMSVEKVDFEGNVEGLPIDPFGQDGGAPDGTYCKDLKLTITYRPKEPNDGGDEPDPDDPSTWCSISAVASAQFLSPPVRKSKWRSIYTGGGFDEVEIKEPDVQAPIICPMIEWSIGWPQITHDFFKDTLMSRLRDYLGKVNTVPMHENLYGAPAWTFQFVGWSMSRELSWRPGRPTVKLDMKFLEKNFKDHDGQQVTHYHHWKPGEGWKIIVDGNNNFLYPATNLNNLFRIEAGEL